MLAVESSRPVSLYEAHFKAMGVDLPRPLVKPSKTAKKKPPTKGFRLARKKARGGFARDKEIQRKFKIKGIAKEKKSDLETVDIRPRKSKKQKEDEEALEIIRDEKLEKPKETLSKTREAEINRKLDSVGNIVDDKLFAWSEVAQSVIDEARIFGSEPAPSRRRNQRRRTTGVAPRKKLEFEEQIYRDRNIPYADDGQMLEDYPQNIAMFKALRDEKLMSKSLYNELEAKIRQYNSRAQVEEDEALERTAQQHIRILRQKERQGGHFGGIEGQSILGSAGASSISSELQSKFRQRREQRAQQDRDADEEFLQSQSIARLKRGQKVFSAVDGAFYQDRQEQKDLGLLEHSSESATSSGDVVRRDRGLSAWTEQEDELSSGNLRSDGTSTAEREAVASSLDRSSQARLSEASDSGGSVRGVEKHFRRTLERQPAVQPEPQAEAPKKLVKATETDADLRRKIDANVRRQTAIDAELTRIRRGGGRTGRSEQLSLEAPLITELTQLGEEERRLRGRRSETERKTRQPTRSEKELAIRLGSDRGGNSTAEAIRFASEVGTTGTGGTAYGVKPRSKQQAQTLISEMAEQEATRPVESVEQEDHFANLESYLVQQKEAPALDLSPLTPRTAEEETTPRARGERGGGTEEQTDV